MVLEGNDIDSRIWDRFCYIKDKIVNYEAAININNLQIKGLGDGNENSDAVNVKQLNESETNVTNYVISAIEKINTNISKENPTVNNNKRLISLILDYIFTNEEKIPLIKELYFSDSLELRKTNSYWFVTTGDIKGDFTFYYVFQHNASTNNVLIIHIRYLGITDPINIFVSKNQIVISNNPLINETYLRAIDIKNNALGKQLWFWIWIKERVMNVIFSGISSPINIPDIRPGDVDDHVQKIAVDDNPFTKRRGFMTKNIYDNNSEAYQRVEELERN